jgi:adenosine deaminase CECR1
MKFIYSTLRRAAPGPVYLQMIECLALQRQFPDHLIGYDLVDQEDRYHSLYYYLDDFLKVQNDLARQGKPPLKFFFHAGETDWNNRYNLYDAFLLNSTRIGHGFALPRYPKLIELARQRKVAVEVSPPAGLADKLITNK